MRYLRGCHSRHRPSDHWTSNEFPLIRRPDMLTRNRLPVTVSFGRTRGRVAFYVGSRVMHFVTFHAAPGSGAVVHGAHPGVKIASDQYGEMIDMLFRSARY